MRKSLTALLAPLLLSGCSSNPDYAPQPQKRGTDSIKIANPAGQNDRLEGKIYGIHTPKVYEGEMDFRGKKVFLLYPTQDIVLSPSEDEGLLPPPRPIDGAYFDEIKMMLHERGAYVHDGGIFGRSYFQAIFNSRHPAKMPNEMWPDAVIIADKDQSYVPKLKLEGRQENVDLGHVFVPLEDGKRYKFKSLGDNK